MEKKAKYSGAETLTYSLVLLVPIIDRSGCQLLFNFTVWEEYNGVGAVTSKLLSSKDEVL